jgi:hypothetical protein
MGETSDRADLEELLDISGKDLDEPDWKIYQKIVAGLHADEDTNVETEHSYPIPGSGTKEIDVVVWDQSEHYEYTVLIECKFHSDPVSQSVVDSVNGYFQRSDADKAVIVSKAGFQSGAIERAEGTGVELLTLRRFIPDTDLANNAVRYLNFNLNICHRHIDVLDMDLEPLNKETSGEEKEVQIRFNRQNSRLFTTAKEPLNETLLDRLTEFKQTKDTGTHTEEFDEIALLIEGKFFKLNTIEYEITESIAGNEYEMDLFENIDLYYKDELTGDEEYESLSDALAGFREHVVE